MGSAAAYHLARRGLSVVALERHDLAHGHGSSHGLSRIIRLAYFEHPSYVPLLRRAFSLWRELEEQSGNRLLHVTGAIDAGRPGSRVLEGSLESCRVHDLPHELLTATDLARRFPAWHLPDEYRAVFQPDGGFLEPEKCILAHAGAAVRHGADIRTRATVERWARGPHGVVVTVDGTDLHARQLVVCAGAWTGALVPALGGLLRPERQVVAWFSVARPADFVPDRFPVFVLTTPDGHYYGFPEFGVPGFKIGKYHHRAQQVDPDRPLPAVDHEDEDVLRRCVRAVFPGADGLMLRSSTCLFTNTPDEHFIIDRLRDAPEVVVVSACSGHGFKFCSVIGEVVADLVTTGRTPHDISLFTLDRFH